MEESLVLSQKATWLPAYFGLPDPDDMRWAYWTNMRRSITRHLDAGYEDSTLLAHQRCLTLVMHLSSFTCRRELNIFVF